MSARLTRARLPGLPSSSAAQKRGKAAVSSFHVEERPASSPLRRDAREALEDLTRASTGAALLAWAHAESERTEHLSLLSRSGAGEDVRLVELRRQEAFLCATRQRAARELGCSLESLTLAVAVGLEGEGSPPAGAGSVGLLGIVLDGLGLRAGALEALDGVTRVGARLRWLPTGDDAPDSAREAARKLAAAGTTAPLYADPSRRRLLATVVLLTSSSGNGHASSLVVPGAVDGLGADAVLWRGAAVLASETLLMG